MPLARRHHQQGIARGELGAAPDDEGQLLLGGRPVRDAVMRSAVCGGATQCGGLARTLDKPVEVLGRGEGGAAARGIAAKDAAAEGADTEDTNTKGTAVVLNNSPTQAQAPPIVGPMVCGRQHGQHDAIKH